MKRSFPYLRQRAVGHFLREDMFEGHHWLQSSQLLVEQLHALEAIQALRYLFFGLGQDLHEQAARTPVTNHRQRLQQRLLFNWQAVDTRPQHALHSCGELDSWWQGHPALASQRALFRERLGNLLQEEGITLRLGEDRLP
jgi:hypothetical protein